MSDTNGTIRVFGTERKVRDESVSWSQTATVSQVKRIEEQCPEALSLQEATRMLLEEGIQAREERVTAEDIQESVKSALERVEEQLDEGLDSLDAE